MTGVIISKLRGGVTSLFCDNICIAPLPQLFSNTPPHSLIKLEVTRPQMQFHTCSDFYHSDSHMTVCDLSDDISW